MILEFRVRNYRSFRDKSVLSLVASGDKSHRDRNVIETGIRSLPGALRAVAIYGGNASGKSNLVRALSLMRGLVLGSTQLQPGNQFNVQPFQLDLEHRDKPSEFELTFIKNGTRYQYGFSVTPQRIHSEWLIVYQTSQPQTWFTRGISSETGKDEYKFGPNFSGQKNLWKESTRPNALFLSTAVQLNSVHLRDIYDYMQNMQIVGTSEMADIDKTLRFIQENTSRRVEEFLAAADIGISGIDLASRKGVAQSFQFDAATGEVKNTREEREFVVPLFQHAAKNGIVAFEYPDESEGTQKLFALAGHLFEIVAEGQILVIDELDRSLHPLLVKLLIEIFQDPDYNKTNAQLVFTTHNTSLLHSDILRRDQVWFTEKDGDGASMLAPLSSFAPRKHEALERGYLAGRYGGVPIVGRPRIT